MRVILVPLNKRLVFPDGHVEEGFRVKFEERTMTKGEKLIWDLFMKFREVLPATPENTRWAHEWAAVFHEMYRDEPDPAPGAATTAADHDDEGEPPDEPDEDPHEHGVPNRGGAGSGRRKKK